MSDRWPEGVTRHVLARTDSTNAEALRLAPGLSGPAWILAREQTAARGRRGRGWSMPDGNFAGTLILRPKGGPAAAAQFSFVAALALYDALGDACGPSARLAIKWPNDVLLNGGKVAGILLESTGRAGGYDLAIGIGVNLIGAPDASAVEPGAVPPVSLLGETGLRIAPEVFLDALAPAYARWEAAFVHQGFTALREEWLAHAARLGEVIRARTGTQTREGTFETIDSAGNLILRMSSGPVAIPAAEVFF